MNDKITITHNETQNSELKVLCELCLQETRHVVLHSVELVGQARGWDYCYSETYQVIKCQGCDSLSFRKEHSNSEDMWNDDETGESGHVISEELYPKRANGRKKIAELYLLPYQIKDIYEETHLAICNKQRILSCIGMRALIESVCKEKGAIGKKLSMNERISTLVKENILSQSAAEILLELKDIGNDAAHEVSTPSENVINTAMDVVEHLLKEVYIFPKLAGQLSKSNRKFAFR